MANELDMPDVFMSMPSGFSRAHKSRMAGQMVMLGLAVLSASVHCADVYQSTLADGSVRFSTTALDKTAVLVLRGELEVTVPMPTEGRERDGKRLRMTGLIDRIAIKHGVDTSLVHAIIEVESHFNPAALSPKGAFGAMQLMPATAHRYGVTDKTDSAQNIEAGVRYLKDLLHRHDDNLALALAAYNAGEGSVSRHGRRIPPYRETMLYVPAVLAQFNAHRALQIP